MSELTEFRKAKDEFFATHPQSPLTPEQRSEFTGLRYYDEEPALAIVSEPRVFEDPELVDMQTSTGETAPYLRWARVHFSVDDRDAELTVYRDPGSGDLFLPFQDANAGNETYGAGRYLGVDEQPDGRLLLDFNYAYNPYCAYNDAWSCPLPPPENRLRIAIRAGERSFEDYA
ncbi:MAG: DUF1684 domain-containing protein [Dehalococcoidia bacterium]|nr:DUF1684 domain-containing protein [Dehalococcoidia bacterium]